MWLVDDEQEAWISDWRTRYEEHQKDIPRVGAVGALGGSGPFAPNPVTPPAAGSGSAGLVSNDGVREDARTLPVKYDGSGERFRAFAEGSPHARRTGTF